MIDEWAEWGFRPLLKGLYYLIRLLVWLLWEWLCEHLCWYLGWPLVRLLTLGRYPRVGIHHQDQASQAESLVVIVAGLAWPLLTLWLLAPFA